jgi:hypothetical protein
LLDGKWVENVWVVWFKIRIMDGSLLKGIEVAQAVGNCDIDLFIFRHCFCIMKPKFPKVERD